MVLQEEWSSPVWEEMRRILFDGLHWACLQQVCLVSIHCLIYPPEVSASPRVLSLRRISGESVTCGGRIQTDCGVHSAPGKMSWRRLRGLRTGWSRFFATKESAWRGYHHVNAENSLFLSVAQWLLILLNVWSLLCFSAEGVDTRWTEGKAH